MTRRIIIVGMAAPYHSGEVWGCNLSYKFQKLSKLYFMDDISELTKADSKFVERVNKLNIPVVASQKWPGLKCKEFDLSGTLKHFRIGPYFTSTIAYMMADAVRERPGEIVLHNILSPSSSDYMHQKPCLDFWCGMAKGRGIEVTTSNSNLMKPMPWQTGLYGYEPETDAQIKAYNTVKTAMKEAMRYV